MSKINEYEIMEWLWLAEYHSHSFLSVYIAHIFLSALYSTLLSQGMNYCSTSQGKHAINLSQSYVELSILRPTSQFPSFVLSHFTTAELTCSQ